MIYHVEYFDRHYAESGGGASAHTVEAMERRLNEQAAQGWRLHSSLQSSIGWILIYERDA